jgi:hypothetical protein
LATNFKPGAFAATWLNGQKNKKYSVFVFVFVLFTFYWRQNSNTGVANDDYTTSPGDEANWPKKNKNLVLDLFTFS